MPDCDPELRSQSGGELQCLANRLEVDPGIANAGAEMDVQCTGVEMAARSGLPERLHRRIAGEAEAELRRPSDRSDDPHADRLRPSMLPGTLINVLDLVKPVDVDQFDAVANGEVEGGQGLRWPVEDDPFRRDAEL